MRHIAPIRSVRRVSHAVALAGLILAALVAAGSTGCAAVKPWQRGTLARRCMLPTPDPAEETLEQHFFSYREGSAGGTGGTGGGCGCN